MKMTKKEASDKQEKLVASFLDWDQVRGSGCRPTHTGDVESDTWLGECKTHVKPGNKIKFDVKIWNKIVDEACAKFKKAAYFVDDGSQDINNTFVVFPRSGITAPLIFDNRSNTNTLIFDRDSVDDRLYEVKLGKLFLHFCKISTFKEVMWSC